LTLRAIRCYTRSAELAHIIINDRTFYDLPRKFNIAFDGGGLIGTVEDTNDIGAKAVKVGDEVFFRLALGGATGHQAFARDLGVLVPPGDLNEVIVAIVRVFIAKGNRQDRKRARLKHLLETLSSAIPCRNRKVRVNSRAPMDPL
jgi:ferredoxin-nitrite reductase